MLTSTKSFMKDPKKILVKSKDLTLEVVDQYYVEVE